jgi:hypothetical protein
MPLVGKDTTRSRGVLIFDFDFHHSGTGEEVKDTQDSGQFVDADAFTSVGILKDDILIVVVKDLTNNIFSIAQSAKILSG